MNEEITKTCSKCGIKKELYHFPKKKHGRVCTICRNLKNKEYRKLNKNKSKMLYQNNKELIKEKYKNKLIEINEQYNKDKDKPKICNICLSEKLVSDFYKGKHICKLCTQIKKIQYIEYNKEKIRETNRIYTLNNKERLKEYRQENKDIIDDYQKEYRIKNKKKRNEHHNSRYNSDYKYKTICLIRGAISRMVKRGDKTGKSIELLGCDINFLISHFENMFTSEMTWANQGIVWHIDHIKPISSFENIEICPIEQRLCSNWRNLQPLLAIDNMKKHDKWDITIKENINHEKYLLEALSVLDIKTLNLIIKSKE